MAAPQTPDTSEIRRKGRQRLIGAIALVVLAVVFVPMLLDPQPRQERQERSLAIPPKEGAAPLPPPEPAAAKPESAAAIPQPEPPKTAGAPVKAAAPAKTAPEPKAAEPKPAAPAKATAKVAAPAAAPRLEGFAVQVGAFRDEGKLSVAREKLVAAKVPHYTERLDSANGALTRLRAGPYPSREAAEKAAAAIGRAGLEGKVVALP